MFEKTKPEFEPKPPELDYYVLLDFDRCIGNTDRLQAILEDVVAHHSFISPHDMKLARQNEEASGGSFDTASWVRRQLVTNGQGQHWEDIASDFVDRGLNESLQEGGDVLMPGAHQLLEHLDECRVAYGFLTFGSPEWQTAKLHAAGQAMAPQLIVDSKRKGRLIDSWWQPESGYFRLPPQLSNNQDGFVDVKHLVFLDDKPVSFEEAPRFNTTLIHVMDPSGKIVSSQRGETPPGVLLAKGLDEAKELLKFDNKTADEA